MNPGRTISSPFPSSASRHHLKHLNDLNIHIYGTFACANAICQSVLFCVLLVCSLGAECEGRAGYGGGQVEAFGDFSPDLLVDDVHETTLLRHQFIQHVQVQHLLGHDGDAVHGSPCKHTGRHTLTHSTHHSFRNVWILVFKPQTELQLQAFCGFMTIILSNIQNISISFYRSWRKLCTDAQRHKDKNDMKYYIKSN